MLHIRLKMRRIWKIQFDFFFFFFEKQVLCSLTNFKHIITLNSIVIENNNGIFNVYLIG